VLVACERSGVVRDAFLQRGHDAWSCDLEESRSPGPHFKADALQIVCAYDWDILIAHPPCTHICVSGARWFAEKRADGRQQEAVDFFMRIIKSDVPKIVVENPVCILSSIYRKPDQIIQPWMFGHGETKATCLWLKGVEKLVATKIVEGRDQRIHRIAPGQNRSESRSKTYSGIADAMATQWG